MSQTIDVNGQSINYPETGDTNWGDEATDFAVQTSAALGKLGLASGTSVDIAQTLDVTGNTTLDANLSVAGTTSLTGNVTLTNNLTVNGNTALGNASGDTTTVTGIVNVDSGVLYVDPVNNRVGINDTTPSEALDVTGNVAITGNETVGGTLGITGDVSVNTNKFNITASSGNTSIAGTLGVSGDVSINTNKFNVTASSGNTTIAGQILSSDGTSLLPGISFSSDPNTGLYRIGSDKVGFTANGTRVGEFGSGYGGFVGNIIQVVSTTKKDTQTITTTSWGTAISGLSVTITPKYSNSLIYLSTQINSSQSAAIIIYFRLYRDSTLILVGDAAGSRDQVSFAQYPAAYTANNILSTGIIGVDSPATMSAITYSVQCRSSSGTVYVNRTDVDTNTSVFPRAISTITAMEIQQ